MERNTRTTGLDTKQRSHPIAIESRRHRKGKVGTKTLLRFVSCPEAREAGEARDRMRGLLRPTDLSTLLLLLLLQLAITSKYPAFPLPTGLLYKDAKRLGHGRVRAVVWSPG